MSLNAGLLVKAVRAVSSRIVHSSTVVALAGVLAGAGLGNAQGVIRATPDRLVQPVNENARVTLGGTVHPLANRANDRGAVADGLKLDRVQIVLKRSDAQEAELKQAISDMHAPGSASYHKWLTPDEFGKRFGPSDADVAKLTTWLQAHGFSVTKLNPGRQTLEMTGSAGQFRDAFKTQIHNYQVKSATGTGLETHYANAADPQIPAALAPVFGGFASLNNFRLKSYSHRLGSANYNTRTHESKPDWTVGTSPFFFLVSPGDFAVQYNLPSQATAGTNDGTNTSIAIINESNINISLVNRFRTLFGLPANPPQVIIDGNDPGIDGINNSDGQNGASFEAYLDVEWAGAVAPAATVNLVIGADTALEGGLILAAERAVYSNISPVMSISFGNCEANLGSSNAFLSTLWEQAAAQGITVLVSSGDSGSAGCDNGDSQAFAVGGQAVSGFASTPYNVAVGGTDFYYAGGSADLGTYWNLQASDATPVVSLKKTVPEQPFNDSQFGLNLNNYDADNGTTTIFAASGGASTCALGTTDANGTYTCTGGYPKPSWQKGAGVPADAVRDLPDVSLFGALGENNSNTPICAIDADCVPVASSDAVQVSGVGGTSVAAPSFSGIMALVNQQYGRQGQANFVLYPLATQFPEAFHDVTVGSNAVPCNLQTVSDGTYDYSPVDCQTVSNEIDGTDRTYGTSLEGEIGLTAGTAAYNAAIGYDLASGLGTVNVKNLLADWGKVTFASSTVTLTPSSTSITHGTAVTLSGTVTGTGTPTGDVALETDSSAPLTGTYFPLANGAFTQGVYLPGGTYDIWGNYAGDNANAASSSVANKVQVTVAPEASTTALTAYTINVTSNGISYPKAPAILSYGEQVVLSALAGPSSGSKTDSAPTGSVAFTNNGVALNTAVMNSEGEAAYFGTYPASATAYSIKAAYSGDNSYQASTSAAATFTVTKNTPMLYLSISNSDSQGVYGPQQTFLNIIYENSNGYTQNALAPTGTVTVTGGPSGTLTGTLSQTLDPGSNAPYGVATVALPSGIESGTVNLTVTYTGDSNYNGVPATKYPIPFRSAGTGLASTTTVAASPTSSSPATLVQLTTKITGQSGKPAPTGNITVYGSGIQFGDAFTLPAGSGDSTAITLLFDSQGLLQGSNQFTVQYSGDTNYLPSSGTAIVSNPLSDFQIVPLTTIVNVPVSGTATDTINLTSTTTFAGAVTFTCKGAGGVTCSVNPAAATLTAGESTSVSLTVNATGVTAVGTYNVVVTASDSTGNFVHTLGLEAVVPQLPVATPAITLTNSAPIAIASQGASGTSTITVTPSGGFTGTVALSCAVTASPTGATETPTCALTPASISVASTAAVTSTLTVSTTAVTTTSQLKLLLFGGSGVTMAALFFFGGPISRRGRLTVKAMKTMRILSAAALFALIAGAALGCGSSSHSGSGGGGGGGTTGGTTIGAYTVTVTATPASGTAATTTVAVTVK